MKAYITRDYDGYLMLSLEKPERPTKMWFGKGTLRLPTDEFPEVKATDTEPTEAEIRIKR